MIILNFKSQNIIKFYKILIGPKCHAYKARGSCLTFCADPSNISYQVHVPTVFFEIEIGNIPITGIYHSH